MTDQRGTSDRPMAIVGAAGLRSLVGTELGVSEWVPVTQEHITAFAGLTRDDYWMHTDPEKARAEGLDGTIAHGLFTLGLGPGLSYSLYTVAGFRQELNYGYGKVRFPAPLPVGARVRMRAALTSVEERPAGGIVATVQQVFEYEGGDRPVCVAEQLSCYVP